LLITEVLKMMAEVEKITTEGCYKTFKKRKNITGRNIPQYAEKPQP